MLSTMQDGELSIGTLLRYGTTVHGTGQAMTWTGESGRHTSYAELGPRCARLASALRALGIRSDDRVATFQWNNTEHLTAYLTVPAMGAVLHTLNIRLPADQLTFIVNHAADRVIIADATLLPLLEPLLPTFRTVEHVIVVGGDPGALTVPAGISAHAYDELLAAATEDVDWPDIDERTAAALCYTSGTTGPPKGVAYSHRSIWLHSMQLCMSDAMALAQSDRTLAIVPMFHAMSWGLPYAAMMVGTSLIMPDRFLAPEALARIIAAERPTYAAAVPTIWQGLLRHLETHPQDLSSLREVIIGGSTCPPSLIRAFHDRHGVRVVHAWGMTETSPLGSVARTPAAASDDQAWAYRFTQGRFPAGVRARLVDDDGAEVAWDGESVGELQVRGPWVTGGYYEVTADGTPRVAVDPEKFHDGWLRTGDVGTITPDGFLRLTDRMKDVIKSGGEWISSVELESLVMDHPAVAEAAVVGIPDEKWGERPLVAVVVRAGHSVTPEDLREFLNGRVARWQLPENWTFIDEVPKTTVGKYDKNVLRRQHADGRLVVRRID